MARFRRRKFKGTWLPVYGTIFAGEGSNVVGTGLQGEVDANLDGSHECIVIPLTPDTPVEDWDETVANNNLQNTIGSEWALRRIVGKLLIWRRDAYNASSADYWVKVAAGFFVARAQSEQQSVPIGLSSNPAVLGSDNAEWESFSPLAQKTTREPWIWRRSWVLQGPSVLEEVTNPSSNIHPTFPSSTAGYGSVLDGPHIDAKTRRRIGQDERLWFAIACSTFPYDVIDETPLDVPCGFDLDIRLFGALRRARGRGAF